MNTVNATLAATTARQDEKNTPIKGTASLVGGVMSATMFKKKQIDSSTVISVLICARPRYAHVRKQIFSHESGGNRKPSTVMTAVTIQGRIKLNA
jgi:hypothetical protein